MKALDRLFSVRSTDMKYGAFVPELRAIGGRLSRRDRRLKCVRKVTRSMVARRQVRQCQGAMVAAIREFPRNGACQRP